MKIKDLEHKVNDLKFQVRHELMKNENIEKVKSRNRTHYVKRIKIA